MIPALHFLFGTVFIVVLHNAVFESTAILALVAMLYTALFIRYIHIMVAYKHIKNAPVNEILFGIIVFLICAPLLVIPHFTGLDGYYVGCTFINVMIFQVYMFIRELHKTGVWGGK